jgi:tetratricopeptide (TPR) repeat protein
MKRLSFLFCFIYAWHIGSAQQLKVPAPSPAQYIKQDFGLGTIELSYSRPSKKGRTIFGDLVPYGKVWRTGANSATTIQFSDEVIIGGVAIKPGKYGLLTIPNINEWTIIISKQTDVTSPSEYKQEEDIVRVNATAKQLEEAVESFTIEVANIATTSCELSISWENAIVSLPIKTEIDSRVMKQIEQTLIKDNRPYFSGAAYYIDNGKDLNQAVIWLDKAIANNPKAYWIYYRKAVALEKLGKKNEAKESAQKSLELATEEQDDTYIQHNKKLLESLK